jgi:hypothetical protein
MNTTTSDKPILLKQKSYLAFIRNSVGSQAFRHFYAIVDGYETDIINEGELACGFFASSVLHFFEMIREPHLTVAGNQRDIEASEGWQEVPPDDRQPGDVLIWASAEGHRHIGFYSGNDEAVSTDSRNAIVAQHAWDFGGARAVEKVYRYTFS